MIHRFKIRLLWPALILLCPLVSSCAADTIESRRTGQQVVCHKQKKTLTVSNADSFVHLDHGDSPGPCAEEKQ